MDGREGRGEVREEGERSGREEIGRGREGRGGRGK